MIELDSARSQGRRARRGEANIEIGRRRNTTNLRLEVKQGAHPNPLEGIAGADHVGDVAHKGVVCPEYVHVHWALEEAGDHGRWVEGLHVEECGAEKMQGKKEKAVGERDSLSIRHGRPLTTRTSLIHLLEAVEWTSVEWRAGHFWKAEMVGVGMLMAKLRHASNRSRVSKET